MGTLDRRGGWAWRPLTAGCLLALLAGACTAPAVEMIGEPTQRAINPWGDAFYVETTRREGARQSFLLLKPAAFQAAVILLAGGNGWIALEPTGVIRRDGNFLVRSREEFRSNGLLVAVLDVPSDRRSLDGFRTSPAHALDVKGVIAYLRSQADVPVWLVGTSRGTVSAVAVTAHLSEGGPDGLVLTATVFAGSRLPTVYNARLEAIRVPTLLLHHREDACGVTPYSGTGVFMKSLVNGPLVELISVEGGGQPRGPACEAFHKHGFIGQEAQVVKRIADWIKAHPPR